MTRRRILALIVVLAALALVVTARVPFDRGDSLTVALSAMYLAGLQALVLLGAWIVALRPVPASRRRNDVFIATERAPSGRICYVRGYLCGLIMQFCTACGLVRAVSSHVC